MKKDSVSEYFNTNWQKYQKTLRGNTLYHKEMSETLNVLLTENILTPFSFVDVGCGDASTIASVLINKPIKKYIGIDAAAEVLKMAETNLEALHCEKEFICDDISNAIVNISPSVDIIFASYVLHHLSQQQKIDFIKNCQEKLNNQGFFILVDEFLQEGQTREEWLDFLAARMRDTQSLTSEELEFRMRHPRQDDHPETIRTFEKIAQNQNWKKFSILVKKDICAFMVFFK